MKEGLKEESGFGDESMIAKSKSITFCTIILN